jgi:hypothetical protein
VCWIWVFNRDARKLSGVFTAFSCATSLSCDLKTRQICHNTFWSLCCSLSPHFKGYTNSSKVCRIRLCGAGGSATFRRCGETRCGALLFHIRREWYNQLPVHGQTVGRHVGSGGWDASVCCSSQSTRRAKMAGSELVVPLPGGQIKLVGLRCITWFIETVL